MREAPCRPSRLQIQPAPFLRSHHGGVRLEQRKLPSARQVSATRDSLFWQKKISASSACAQTLCFRGVSVNVLIDGGCRRPYKEANPRKGF